MRLPRPRSIVPALAAMAGVVVAHTLDYLVVFPAAHQRAAELHGSGHSYWPAAVAGAVAAAAVALILAALGGARLVDRAGRPRSRAAERGRGDFGLGPVLAWQVAAFVLMETGERAMAAVPPSGLLHSPVFWLGLLLQLPVAWLATRLLKTAEDVAHRTVSRRRGRGLRSRPRLRVAVHIPLPAAAAPSSPARPRAPPLVAPTA